ncbi:MAG: RagB/SusD family nutrient uptake outer membrane protein [Paludibacter sp.]|nr:RagB/SusD family nutrient uptake outer membrane protein [Paludibacter sp.]
MYTKIFKYIFLSVIFAIIGVSCDLELNPLNKFSDETLWSSEENAKVALTGLYRGDILFNSPEYQPSDWWSYGGLIFLEFASDNLYDRRGNASNFFRISNGLLVSNNPFVTRYWTNTYKRIAQCNRFLENIKKLPETTVTKRYAAEARFIRACQYFYLSQYFQDVPLVTTVLTREEANIVKRDSNNVVTQFVIDELKAAVLDLPRFKNLSASEIGRASKQAALAFLGRIYMAENKWSDAAIVYKEIIDYGDNQLAADYKSLFIPQGENSSENIFSMQYLESLAGQSMPQHALPAKDGGWCIVNVPASLFESYQFTDGTNFSYNNPLYDPDNLGKNRDPRLDYTILYNGAMFMGKPYISHPDSVSSPDRVMGGQTTQTGFMMRKYFDENYKGNLQEYGGNIPIIRYSEVLLSYLEAKMEAENSVSQTLLDETINLVRGRTSVNMPKITQTDVTLLRPVLRNERRIELACEGIRYWDILRWKIASDVLTKDIYGAPFPGAVRTRVKVPGNPDPHARWYVNTSTFRTPRDYKWPIPQSEQDINPNLR